MDLLLVGFIALYAYRGYRRGFIVEALELGGLLIGVALALSLNAVFGAPFRLFGMSPGAANFTGGAVIFVIWAVGAMLLARRVQGRTGPGAVSAPFRTGGVVLGAGWALLLGSFLIVLITAIPSPSFVNRAIARSLVGTTVLSAESPFYSMVEGLATREARNLVLFVRQYLARFEPEKQIEPEDCLDIESSGDIGIDAATEEALLELVNGERDGRGLGRLAPHSRMREVARTHSSDMYERGYFCHRNPDGLDPFDRFREAEVLYLVAGENLALAPTVELVHRGLMNSPRHRDNILKEGFTNLGVGVYKGPFGLMVTQNFCGGCEE
jgi:uncharacterized protein YkwD/uncharacterized membrane protein required for colicin V production